MCSRSTVNLHWPLLNQEVEGGEGFPRTLPAQSYRDKRCDSGKTIVATVSTKVIIGDVSDALQSSNPMMLNIAPGSRMCTDDSTNIVYAGQIPPGLIAVTFTIGLRSYRGFVKEADFKEADFSD